MPVGWSSSTEYGSCGSSGQCARVAISGSETVLGDRRMLHIPSNALLTAGFRSDHHLVLPRFPSSFGKENGIRLCLFGIKTLLVRYSMAEVGQLIGPLISCGAELYGSRLGFGVNLPLKTLPLGLSSCLTQMSTTTLSVVKSFN